VSFSRSPVRKSSAQAVHGLHDDPDLFPCFILSSFRPSPVLIRAVRRYEGRCRTDAKGMS